jgi:hypothetical protein
MNAIETGYKDCLIKRNILLTLIGESLISLSQAVDVKFSIRKSIGRIGEHSEMEGIRLYEVDGVPDKKVLNLTCEWTSDDGLTEFEPLSFPVETSPTRRGVPFVINLRENPVVRVPECLRGMANFALACPIFVKEDYWGLMIFFSISDSRDWVQDRLSVFNLMAIGFGSLVAMREEMNQLQIVSHYALRALDLIVKSEQASVALRRKFYEEYDEEALKRLIG